MKSTGKKPKYGACLFNALPLLLTLGSLTAYALPFQAQPPPAPMETLGVLGPPELIREAKQRQLPSEPEELLATASTTLRRRRHASYVALSHALAFHKKSPSATNEAHSVEPLPAARRVARSLNQPLNHTPLIECGSRFYAGGSGL
jgi:hypothetical protein